METVLLDVSIFPEIIPSVSVITTLSEMFKTPELLTLFFKLPKTILPEPSTGIFEVEIVEEG